MPRDNAKYKAQRAKITKKLANELMPQKKTPRPGGTGPRYNVNRLWDSEVKGFYLQVGTGGTKTWYYQYRNEYQRKQTYKIGRYPEMTVDGARDEAKVKQGEVVKNVDIQKNKRLQITQGTVAEFSKRYLKTLPWYKSKPNEETIHAQYIVPHLGKYKLKEVDREIIKAWLAKYDNLGAQWVKMRMYAQKFFQEMVDSRRIEYNPVSAIKIPIPKRYKPRKTILTETHMLSVKDFLGKELERHPVQCYYFALLLAVGCRPAELYTLPWEEVDLKRGLLVNVETKTGEKGLVISQTAVKYFTLLKQHTGVSKWCFPSPKDITKPVSNAFRFFYDRMRAYSNMPKVQVRDFRRTFITSSASKTQDIHAVSQLVNHSDISITAQVYDQVDTDRQRKALKQVQKDLALL